MDDVRALLANQEAFTGFVQAVFNFFDTDKSGLIDRSELGNALRHIGNELKIGEPTEEEINQIFADLDTDRSGKIDSTEFATFVRRALEEIISH